MPALNQYSNWLNSLLHPEFFNNILFLVKLKILDCAAQRGKVVCERLYQNKMNTSIQNESENAKLRHQTPMELSVLLAWSRQPAGHEISAGSLIRRRRSRHVRQRGDEINANTRAGSWARGRRGSERH
jgi:hypothetical protein